jgi:Fe-S-cluster-containing hydrogenase component 2
MVKAIRIREERCTGCRCCELICSLDKEGAFSPQKARIKIFQDRGKGFDIPSVCQLCNPAPCVDVCPSGALTKDASTETVIFDKETCLGEKCLKCMSECPYGALSWNITEESITGCDLCGGDPECVKICDRRALQFERCDPAELQQQRKDLEKLLQPLLQNRVARTGRR